jgi:long-chain acyl-CoA synthetase
MLKSQGRADSVKNLISFDKFDEDVRADAKAAGLNIYNISEVIEAGKKALPTTTFVEPEPSQVALFCYTSGTTGDPKAAKLTHANLIAVATGAKCRGFDIDHTDTTISYLPLAHSFEQMLFVTSMVCGSKIGYFGGDVLKLTDDCQVLKPTLFPSVPRIYNRVFDKI